MGGITEYTISDVSYGTEVSLTAPEIFIYNEDLGYCQDTVYYFDRWSGTGCYSLEPTVTVSMTADRDCEAIYIDARRWHCYGSEHHICKPGSNCGGGTRQYEDKTGEFVQICVVCICPETDFTPYVSWIPNVYEVPDPEEYNQYCNDKNKERWADWQCPSDEWEACEIRPIILTCYDCGITCNPDCPEVCCDNAAVSNPNRSTSCIEAHDCYMCEECVPKDCPVTLTVSSTDGGSVTEPGEGTFTYAIGKEVELVASASSSHRFVSWTGPDVTTIADVNATTTTITMDDSYDITAVFIEEHTLTISSGDGGSVTTPGEATFTYDAGTVVDLVATPEGGYNFVNWTGSDVTTIADVNASTTTIAMNGDYIITANFAAIPPPTAAMSCQIINCQGPGCICIAGSWETFYGVNYRINNDSSSIGLPISTSTWSVAGRPGYDKACPGLDPDPECDYGIVNFSLLTDNYDDNIIELEVADSAGITDTAINTIRVKRDTVADFRCSLTGVDPDWHDCIGFAAEQGQIVYFKGEEGTTLSRPSWHAGPPAPAIDTWQWEKGSVDGDGNFVFEASFGNNSHIASTTLTRATSTIHLAVRDNHPGGGRTDQEEHTLNVRLPLPEYREVRPRSQLDNFLARLSSIFTGF